MPDGEIEEMVALATAIVTANLIADELCRAADGVDGQAEVPDLRRRARSHRVRALEIQGQLAALVHVGQYNRENDG